MIMVTDNDGTDPQTTVSEWRVTAEFENASGLHTSDFPTVAPPQSLQDLEKLIEEKLGIGTRTSSSSTSSTSRLPVAHRSSPAPRAAVT